MKLKFHGTLAELRDLLAAYDIHGRWEAKPNGVHMMRHIGGGNVHWANGSKTLWLDGTFIGKAQLAARVETALMADPDS
ncbi:hypothetical protein [Sphingomonas turrisvirgatae]|uniref:Uncharacterized protein n=1 Tax=Sphingomonas turrisvirgatae TaxID=1888892 RepID=A0A1E3M3V7_9SPHN|nr:hypothetical protein [Sphingomonas turrisvirgatae]ODP39760.1 hypothetical protein BFL28_09055 [Sphingomonas turrisvirgatae]